MKAVIGLSYVDFQLCLHLCSRKFVIVSIFRLFYVPRIQWISRAQ